MATESSSSESQNDQATTQIAPGPWISSSHETVGQAFGRYKLLEKLGEGGFGSVWLAEQKEPVRRKVALKIIKLGMDTKAVVARFEAERQALAMMDHPNIAKVLDAGATDSGRPYFVMELVRGIKITEYCDQNQLRNEERLELFKHVCHAIQHAHQKGIIHRDVKPSNILVTLHDGVPVPKVIDFGIAKATQGELTDKTIHTQFQQFVGTPAYMSPEQAEMSGLDIDTRCDIYSLGVVLYELLTGSTPFDANELMSQGVEAMRKTIREKEPVRPSTRIRETLGAADARRTAKSAAHTPHFGIATDLDWIVMKCLEKDRTRRYETANALAADIERHLNNEPVAARPPTAVYRFQKMIRRNRAAAAAISGIVAALAIGLGLAVSALLRERAARARELAQTVRADTVATFIDALLSDAVPMMMKQGNLRGARQLLNTADRLAASSLSNSPASEVNVRYKVYRTFRALADDSATEKQAEIIARLVPKVPDDQLPAPRGLLMLNVPARRLYAAQGQAAKEEKAVEELDGLSSSFITGGSPAPELAMICQTEVGIWHFWAKRFDLAERRFSNAYKIGPAKASLAGYDHRLPDFYARTLTALGKLAEAEKVAREGLAVSPDDNPEARERYTDLVISLSNTLCQQDRFEEALQMLSEERRALASRGATQQELGPLERRHGQVLARAGKVREALAVMVPLAARYDFEAWFSGVILALAAGDTNACRELRRTAVLNFASTAEGWLAFGLADGLVRGGTDEVVVSIARGLVDRVATAPDWSKDYFHWANAFVGYHEGRYEDALNSLNRYLTDMQFGTIRQGSDQVPGWRAGHLYVRAILHAELGHPEEARRDFAKAGAYLKAALPETPGHDRGVEWESTYAGELMREEAKAVFVAKGLLR